MQRTKLGVNFINQYQVKSTKSMLKSEQYKHYNLVAIGFESGFNSKTTFYAAFKRFTATTPSKYRLQITA